MKSKSPHLIREQLTYVGLSYDDLDDAVDKLISCRNTYGASHTNLRLEPTAYSEGELYLYGDRPETPAEQVQRKNKEAQQIALKRATYERLKKEFGEEKP